MFVCVCVWCVCVMEEIHSTSIAEDSCGLVGFGEFYILATCKVTLLGWALTSDSAHSWLLYSVALLGNQVASTMT